MFDGATPEASFVEEDVQSTVRRWSFGRAIGLGFVQEQELLVVVVYAQYLGCRFTALMQGSSPEQARDQSQGALDLPKGSSLLFLEADPQDYRSKLGPCKVHTVESHSLKTWGLLDSWVYRCQTRRPI